MRRAQSRFRVRVLVGRFVYSAAALGLMVCPGAAQVPQGFEVVRITDDPLYGTRPRINNCGEIVFSKRMPPDQIFLYDNGALTRVSPDPEITDYLPQINDDATAVWTHNYGVPGAETIVIYREGVVTELFPGTQGAISNLRHVAWSLYISQPCANPSDVFLWDGETTREIRRDGFSNQGVQINDLDELVWTRYDFCVTPWRSYVMRYSSGAVTQLPSEHHAPRTPDINNRGVVVWGSNEGIQIWEAGVTQLLTDWGVAPKINERGEIAFHRWHDESDTWQAWLYRNGEFFQLTTPPGWHSIGGINDVGEVTMTFGNYPETDIGFLRRVRNGDADLDGDVDADDYVMFLECFTGPERVDGLCKCRFLDIDHDGDVDFADFRLFQMSFTGRE